MTTWLGQRRALALALGLVLLLAACSLSIGFVTDDLAFRAVLHSSNEHARRAWDLFRFQRGDPAEMQQMIRFGIAPWWSAPDLKIHFLRPLTSLLFAADDRIFGDAAVGYHLHSLVWFALLLAGVAALYRQLLPPAAATLGVLVFGFAASHVQGYAWLSARHVIIGGAGAAWALAGCARGGRAVWLGLVALAIGLLGSEAALGAVPIWCAVACTRSDRSQRERTVACAAAVALGLFYLAAYHLLGGGTRASGGYLDPAADPLGFLSRAVVRVPILLGDAALGIPSELAFVVSNSKLALGGALAMVFLIATWFATRGAAKESDPHARLAVWLALAAVIAVLPGAAGYPAGRVLVVPDLGFAAVIGLLLARASQSRPLGKALLVVLALAHVVNAPLRSLHDQRSLKRRGRAVDAIAADIGTLVPAGTRAFVIASDPLVFLYPRGVLAETAPGSVSCWSTISAALAGHKITRVDEHTLIIEPIERPLLDGSFDVLFRDPSRAFAVGDSAMQCGGLYKVTALRDGLPAKIELTFKRRLEDPELTFLVWREKHLEKLALPAAGTSIEIPWSSGPGGAL